MPVVLVHGVPETPAIWNPLRSHLTRDDVVALELPGFGTPRPDGFTASKEEYVSWLIDALASLDADGSVDLVGHDWGAGFVVRVVSIRPDLVRSWATDAPRFGHADFEWHEFAKIWQTPEAGEEFFRTQLAVPQHERGGIFEAFGVPPDEAASIGAGLDQTMADSILALYRSALDVGREWAPDFRAIPAPGLALLPVEDPFLIPDVDPSAAANAGAQVAERAGVGHWWMLQNPAQARKCSQSSGRRPRPLRPGLSQEESDARSSSSKRIEVTASKVPDQSGASDRDRGKGVRSAIAKDSPKSHLTISARHAMEFRGRGLTGGSAPLLNARRVSCASHHREERIVAMRMGLALIPGSPWAELADPRKALRAGSPSLVVGAVRSAAVRRDAGRQDRCTGSAAEAQSAVVLLFGVA